MMQILDISIREQKNDTAFGEIPRGKVGPNPKGDESPPGVSMTLLKNRSMTPLSRAMTPFLKGHGDSRHELRTQCPPHPKTD